MNNWFEFGKNLKNATKVVMQKFKIVNQKFMKNLTSTSDTLFYIPWIANSLANSYFGAEPKDIGSGLSQKLKSRHQTIKTVLKLI